MTPKERDAIYSDLGGVQYTNPEWPDFVRKALADFDTRIRSIPTQDKDAFLQAQTAAPRYTDSKEFRLKFLRADVFDIDKATQRIIKHFEVKRSLFGPESLGRDVTLLQDFNKDDLETLKCGGLQILPRPDQFGRLILFSRQICWKYKHRENLLRALWYLCQSMMECDNAQIRGIVGVGFSLKGSATTQLDNGSWSCDYELTRRIIRTLDAYPIRILAIYTCIDTPYFESVVDVASHIFDKLLRARFRVVRGTKQECKYQLMIMGIEHSDDIPVEEDGTLIVDTHHAWIEDQRSKELRKSLKL
jgi:hypothetical protein